MDPRVYGRGFLCSTQSPAFVPPHYQQISEVLWIAAGCQHSHCSDHVGNRIDVVGEVAHTSLPELDGQGISARLCKQLRDSQLAFFQETSELVGRFVVLFQRRGASLKIVGDACCTRAVFYSRRGEVAAMHAKLVADNLAGEFVKPLRNRLRSGCPGRQTPYDSVAQLTANTFLNLEDGTIERFHPL